MSELTINTTQNVNINFTAASVGDRIFGYLIDTLIKIAYIIAVFVVFFYYAGINDFLNDKDFWTIFAVTILFYSPVIFYSLIMESMMNGQTFGKRLMKTKVVKFEGYEASFGDYLMRWVFRIIEINILSGLIALIAIIVNKTNQRLGDVVAGTAVISLRNNISINHTILQELEATYKPTFAAVIKLSDNDMRIIKETYETSLVTKDYAMLIKLRKKIEEVTAIKKENLSDIDFIKIILKDYNFYTQNI